MTSPIAPVRFTGDALVLLDQTVLPDREVERTYTRWEDVAEAIRTLVVRGAPAIGVAAAFGVVDVFVASQATVDGLAQESHQAVLGVQSAAGVVQAAGGGAGQVEGVVEFTVGEQSGVAGDGRTVELQLDVTVEVNAQGSLWLSPIGFLGRFGR